MTVPLTGKHVLESLFETWRPATLFKREPSIGVFLWILLPVSSYTEAIAQRCSAKKVFLEILQNSQENTSARVSFLIKLQASACNFIKKRLWHRCFPVNYAKFLTAPLLTEHLRWLLLTHQTQWKKERGKILTGTWKTSIAGYFWLCRSFQVIQEIITNFFLS